MKVLRNISELQQISFSSQNAIGLVPTMGALHAGHASLLKTSCQQNAETIVSIFVNPAQFNDPKDLKSYPTTLAADLDLCEKAGVDWVFVPHAKEIYPAENFSTQIIETELSQLWEGASRAGHFAGVCLIITKLFNLLPAHHAYFGEKDWQQLSIVRRLVKNLHFATKIIACPTVREHDGLAMSSRNQKLTPHARKQSVTIFHALQHMKRAAQSGATVTQTRQIGLAHLQKIPDLEVDYLAIVHEDTLHCLAETSLANQAKSRVLFAGILDEVRLIDNSSLAHLC